MGGTEHRGAWQKHARQPPWSIVGMSTRMRRVSGVLLPSTPMPCSTHSSWLSLFFGDVVPSSAMTRVPVGFLTETLRQVEATGSQNRQEGITGYEHTATHSLTRCNSSRIPQRCVHYRTNQMVQCKYHSKPVANLITVTGGI